MEIHNKWTDITIFHVINDSRFGESINNGGVDP